MQAPQKFRTALSGFNREDVVTYIQYIGARHEAEVNQLREELESARREMSALREQSAQTPTSNPAADARVEELMEQCALLEQEKAAQAEELAQLQTRVDQLTAELEDAAGLYMVAQRQKDQELEASAQAKAEAAMLREQLEQVKRQRDEALANNQAAQSRTEEELAAYRRAEQVERLARNRASQMFDLANGTLADTAAQLDNAAAALGQAAEKTLAEIRVLQTAVTGSKQVLSDAAATLSAIQPEQIGE